MRTSALILLSCIGVTFILLWMIGQIRYRITETALEVRLFGMCIRQILLTDIRSVSKHRTQICEKWPNTLFPAKRTLLIERKSGRIKYFLITPQQRYVFKADLVEAVRAATRQPAAEVEEPEES